MNNIVIDNTSTKQFALRKTYSEYTSQDRVNRLKAYNHDYYLKKKQGLKKTMSDYYIKNKESIFKKILISKPKRPTFFIKENKDILIDFS